MPDKFHAVALADNVHWVGAIDWSVRNFHGYLTSRGTTYNAYLVLGEKITLVDTVKAPFQAELMARIASVIDPADIDYIVSNHAEMDHSGCLVDVARAVGPEKVFASKMGVQALEAHFHGQVPLVEVADGQQLDIGGDKLSFLETKMCHWPDSMVSYLHGRRLLFSQDAFGMHLATTERFDDELPEWLLEHEGAKYYANILLPLSKFVAKAIEKVASSGLPLAVIAPDHGPVWRRDPGKVVGWYSRWAAQKRKNKAVIVFDSMWGSTGKMAASIADGLMAGGSSVRVLPLEATHRSDVATEILDAGALLVGSPTINGQIFPTVADVLCYLKGLAPRGLIGMAFGSFGWGGEATGQLASELTGMGIQQAAEPIRVKYVPTDEDLSACRQAGMAIAAKLKASSDK
jgi:flavorubredoxin